MISLRNVIGVSALAATVLAGSAYLMDAEPVEACIHPAAEFKYPIKSGAQKGLIFFADGRQEMVIRPSYKVETDGVKVKNDAIEGFTTVAWVIPTPSLPDRYEEADEALFEKLDSFTKAEAIISPDDADAMNGDWKGAKREEHQGAEFLEEVSVGDYTIQPIKAHGEIGGMELKGWLTDNGFGALEDDVVKYYLDNDYYWLAIKLQKAEGLPVNGEVKPLHIGFKTEHPVYPIKINQGRGSFDLELWLISDQQVDLDATRKFGLETVEQRDPLMEQRHRETEYAKLPEEVRKVSDKEAGLAALKEGKLYTYRFFGVGLGSITDLEKLEKDLTFSFKDSETEDTKTKEETDE